MPNPFGQIVDTSRSNGASVSQSWAFLFDRNEELFRKGRTEAVLTDGQLTTAMFWFFPDRLECQAFRNVRKVRAAYNRGALKGVPARPRRCTEYRRYEDGMVVRR